MKTHFLLFVLLFQCNLGFSQSDDLAFTVSIEDTTPANWPGLHSFAFAEWQGYWIIVAGRSNGLHGFFPFTGFPEQTANNQIWVLDPVTGDLWQKGLEDLDPSVAAPLQSSNPQYVQKEEKLYVFGGYGKDTATDLFVTFDQLTVIDLPTLINAIQNDTNVAEAVNSITDERIRLCGGEAHQLGEWTYLVGGHNFNGLYSQSGAPAFTQEYSSEIRKFQLTTDAEGTPQVIAYEAFSDPEFHRRDLSVAPCILEGGEEGLCAYGGVFRPEADLPYLHPIYISENGIEINEDYEQLMSQYTCPILPVYDMAQDEMHSVFFGGLSFHTYDAESQTFVEEELIPFIPSFTMMSRAADGTIREQVLNTEFDELLGTNAKLVLFEDVPLSSEGVIDLNSITETQEVAYIYGGIKAVIPNITPSSASNRLFKVWLHPNTSTASSEVLAEREIAKIQPNPFSYTVQLQWLLPSPKVDALLTDALGRSLLDLRAVSTEKVSRETENMLTNLPGGYYQLCLRNHHGQQRLPIIKQ
ncbi:MAG: hypothetical protein ACRBG0_03645 [Lewinella sp.]|uniref:hypothetical protein n=1 Tax=Lewinella sp. TaxID=2004506 RepID=UPI003D6A0E53